MRNSAKPGNVSSKLKKMTLKSNSTKKQQVKPANRIRLVFWKYFSIILLITIFIFIGIKNTYEITKLKQNGKLTKGFIYEKKSVGSKGTIRSFYRFYLNNNYYEGFDDNENLKKHDSVIVIFNPDNPELNRTKEFVEDY